MKMVYLPATLTSTLRWELPRIDEKVLWHLDLGLEQLQKPLEDKQQCASLKLACDYFVEKVYAVHAEWSEGVVLFKGILSSFEERDLLSDYLDILTANMPKSLKLFLQFENHADWPPLKNRHLYHPEAFPRFQLKASSGRGASAALLPPPHVRDVQPLLQRTEGVECRVVCESELLHAFPGLHCIYYQKKDVSEEGKRILDGFLAAEGLLVEC